MEAGWADLAASDGIIVHFFRHAVYTVGYILERASDLPTRKSPAEAGL
jgi:hypothetical protein